jgi:amino acid transporter
MIWVIAAAFVAGPSSALPAAEAAAGPSEVMAAAAVLFFVYLGFEEVANLSEEVRRPGRDIPFALFVGLAITTILYILVSLAILRLAAPSELAASEAPLATAIAKVWPRAEAALSAIALFATANTVLITLIAASRLAFAMARDRELPKLFARLLPARRTPWIAAIALFAISAGLLPLGDLKTLAEMSSFAALIAFLSVNVVLIVLRYREPGLRRPFRAPLAVGRMPIVPLAAIGAIILLLVHFEWRIYAAGAVAIIASGIAFLARRALPAKW